VINITFKKSGFFIFFLILACLYQLGFSDNRNILYLNSYNSGNDWSDEITRGIIEEINEYNVTHEDMRATLYIEYMDSKRFAFEEINDSFKSLYLKKYDNIDIDLIIVSDNNALDFVRDNYDQMFYDIPVVFCGINDFKDEMIRGIENNVTGMVVKTDIFGTLYWAVKQNPYADSIYVFIDNLTSTGKAHEQEMSSQISRISGVNIILKKNLSIEDAVDEARNIKSGNIILILTLFTNIYGESVNMENAAFLLSENSEAPVYGVWKPQIDYGIVGGNLIDPYLQGLRTVEISLKILDGTEITDIPIEKTLPDNFIFNYDVMEKYGIKKDNLPENAYVLNKPESLFEKNIYLMMSIIIIIVALFLIIAFLILNRFKNKKYTSELKAKNENLEELNEELMAYEEELSASNEELNRQYFELEKNKEEIEVSKIELIEMNKKMIISRNRFQSLFERTPLAMIIWDKDKKIREWNKSAERIFHWKAEDVKGKNFLEFMVPEASLHTVKNNLENIDNDQTIEMINENFTKEGEIIICDWKTAVVRDEKDKSYEIISLGQDITQKYRSEILLRKRFDAEKLINSLSSSFLKMKNYQNNMGLSLEEMSNFIRAEIGFLKVFGEKGEEFHFYSDSEEFIEADYENFDEKWLDKIFKFFDHIVINEIDKNQLIPEEFKKYICKNNLKSVIAFFIKVNESLKGILFFGKKEDSSSWEKEDLTILKIYSDIVSRVLERKKFEEILIKERENAFNAEKIKDKIIADIGHKIRTPMNGILGLSHLISKTELNHEQKEIINMITDSSDKLMKVVNELLNMDKNK